MAAAFAERARTEGALTERARLWLRVRRSGAILRLPFRLPHAPGAHPSARVRLGRGAYVGAGAWFSLPGSRGTVDIGAGTQIAGGLIIAAADRVRIAPGCVLSARVTLLDHGHDYLAWLLPALREGRTPSFTWDITEPAPVTVGAGSWLGVGVSVMPGVTIGEGCVVGAGSVVTADVEPYTVAAGVPARPLRGITDDELRAPSRRTAS